MENIRPYLTWTIRIIVAVLFIFSAYSKLYPTPNFALGTFEAKQLYPLGFDRGTAAYFSRLLIALEFALGLALLLPYFLKKLVVPGTIALLVIFCIHLSYSIYQGVGGSCGCFGELIPMSPTGALIKNIITIGLLVGLMLLLPKDKPRTKNSIPIAILLYAVPAITLFIIAPIKKRSTEPVTENSNQVVIIEDEPVADTSDVIDLDTNPDSPHSKPKIGKTDNVDESPKDTSPKKVTSKFSKHVPAAIKLDEGKKILCLFAPGCEHCMETAKTLTKMRKADPNFPKIYIIFMDEGPEQIPDFFAFAGSPYSYQIADVVSFWEIIGMSKDTPGVVYLWNGNIRYFSDGIDANAFSESALKKELDKVK